MPYLTFSTEVQDETDKPDRKDEPDGDLERLKKAKERYKQLIRQYRDEVVHGSPTLDEAYYHFTTSHPTANPMRTDGTGMKARSSPNHCDRPRNAATNIYLTGNSFE